MGYDVSFHPISPEEMREWYFTPLTWIQQGQEEKVLALAAQHGMEDFYAEKYLNTLRVGAETESNELFDKSHGFYIAVSLHRCRQWSISGCDWEKRRTNISSWRHYGAPDGQGVLRGQRHPLGQLPHLPSGSRHC